VKSTGENVESFPAFDDLFDEDAEQEEENESPAVKEKVEVKVILKEIGQNSEEWKDAMDKFPSAKMFQERLLDDPSCSLPPTRLIPTLWRTACAAISRKTAGRLMKMVARRTVEAPCAPGYQFSPSFGYSARRHQT
jgi:hypothetical protein